MRGLFRFALVGLLAAFGPLSAASAHPVPREAHDRTILVRLTSDAQGGQVVVLVDYRLEVDEDTK